MIHVRAVMLIDPNSPDEGCALQLQVWPLPQDEALLEELNEAIRTAAQAVMVKHKLAGEGFTDLTAKGPMQ